MFAKEGPSGRPIPTPSVCEKYLPSNMKNVFRRASSRRTHPGCASAYVGSTVRNLITRVSEHRGISVRTGTPFLNPPHSSVRSHCLESDHPLSFDQFKIIASSQNFVYLRILESLHILKNKPNLNDMQSAHPLSIVYK